MINVYGKYLETVTICALTDIRSEHLIVTKESMEMAVHLLLGFCSK